MREPRSEGTPSTNDEVDPYRYLYVTGLAAGSLFALGYWAILIVASATGDFTFGGLLITVLVSVAAVLGFLGWRQRRVALTGGSIALLLAGMALGQYVAG